GNWRARTRTTIHRAGHDRENCGFPPGSAVGQTIAYCFSRRSAWPCSGLSARAGSPCSPRRGSTCARPAEFANCDGELGRCVAAVAGRFAISSCPAPLLQSKSQIENLKSFRVPVWLFEAPFADVFEKFIHRHEHYAGTFHVQPQIEIEFVVEK